MVEIAVRWQLNRHVDAVVAAKMGNVVAATSSLNGSDWDGQVLGLTSDGTTEADFLVECGISDLCSSGEGHFIAACDDGLIRVIHKEGVLPLPGGHNDCATSIAMASGREKLVVSGGMDATVMLWDLDTPDRPSKFECHSDGVGFFFGQPRGSFPRQINPPDPITYLNNFLVCIYLYNPDQFD
uniref:Uncharacterized protein n=1 Tax=Rhodosorus marinus TaxID=101924 RepID=A0A7S3A2P4_9RHOD|mmetsp:Transcript_41213/g.162604  ORF Transcript_41213/g.162604 Transcript_41213/m.162604 type:complete len:183 (+) Transcript_41213:137-685(+)